ncbi:hypothetical protein BaRGS_00001466, partial [Batillaria attramentaria]
LRLSPCSGSILNPRVNFEEFSLYENCLSIEHKLVCGCLLWLKHLVLAMARPVCPGQCVCVLCVVTRDHARPDGLSSVTKDGGMEQREKRQIKGGHFADVSVTVRLVRPTDKL